MPTKLQRLTFTFNNQIVQVIIFSLSSIKMIVNTILPILISETIISLFLIRSCTVDDVDCVWRLSRWQTQQLWNYKHKYQIFDNISRRKLLQQKNEILSKSGRNWFEVLSIWRIQSLPRKLRFKFEWVRWSSDKTMSWITRVAKYSFEHFVVNFDLSNH